MWRPRRERWIGDGGASVDGCGLVVNVVARVKVVFIWSLLFDVFAIMVLDVVGWCGKRHSRLQSAPSGLLGKVI